LTLDIGQGRQERPPHKRFLQVLEKAIIMGRELQKKKKRSSIPKVRMKPKSKRVNPLGNAIIAANWYFSPHFSQRVFIALAKSQIPNMLTEHSTGTKRRL
jgi:hypothetical protein